MSDQLLDILKLGLLLLLYLFFFRVLRAVWVEVSAEGRTARSRERVHAAPQPQAPVATGAPTPAAGAAVARAHRLVVVAPDELRGRAYDLADELTIGRAAGCQVSLDDTYASQLHSRLFVREGQLVVEDLGSTNGTYLNRQKVSSPMIVRPGDHLQIGNTVLELA